LSQSWPPRDMSRRASWGQNTQAGKSMAIVQNSGSEQAWTSCAVASKKAAVLS
jgi:hypothetical protein